MCTNDPTVKGVELLIAEFSEHGSLDGYMSTLIAILYFGTVYALESVGKSRLFRPWIRGILGDYAYPVCLLPVEQCYNADV